MALQGKTAVVTGSTSGIGFGIAQALAKDGANIVMNGLGTETDNAKAIAAVKEHGTRVAFDGANMLRHNQIADMIGKAEKTFGAVDILVNNAGIQHVAPIEEFPIEQWDAIIAINLTSAFHTTRAAVPGMKRRRWRSSSPSTVSPPTRSRRALCGRRWWKSKSPTSPNRKTSPSSRPRSRCCRVSQPISS